MSYHSFQSHTELINGELRTQEKRVTIENGAGEVSVTYKGPDGEVLASHTEPLSKSNVEKILDKRFVEDLFGPCLLGCGKYAIEQTPRNAAKLLGGRQRLRTPTGVARRRTRTKRRAGTR